MKTPTISSIEILDMWIENGQALVKIELYENKRLIEENSYSIIDLLKWISLAPPAPDILVRLHEIKTKMREMENENAN